MIDVIDFIKKHKKNLIFIIACVLGSTFLLYLPFLLRAFNFVESPGSIGIFRIYQNFDGLYYTVPALAGGYSPQNIAGLRLEFDLPLEYYAAHLPLYPFFIWLFTPIMGVLKSMIFVTILFSVLLSLMFYYFLTKLELVKNPVSLVVVFIFLPRFLITRSVGAPETLFIFLILGSIYFFEKNKFLLSGFLGALAVITKLPGILLFVAYGMVFLEKMIKEKKITFNFSWLYLGLIPLGVVAVFSLYAVQYNNFFAFFNTGGVVPMLYPFSVFNSSAKWVNTVWLEEIILYLFLYLFAVLSLAKIKYRSIFYFPLAFFIASIFVQHRDLSRYMLPIWPFAAIAIAPILTSKKFVITLIILLPAIYLYALNFMLSNIIPVADWRPFL
jgi:Gpi18-like mannosyltransferase